MKPIHVILAFAAALLLLGCSSVSVTTDYDREANFAALKTYDWITTQENTVTPNAQAAMFQTGLIEKHMKRAVATQLEKKGMEPSTLNPDFYIAFHMGTEQKTQVTSYGTGYGYGYGRMYGGGGVDVHQYTQGTIILDFINSEKKELIWRGVATGALADKPDPSTAEAKINDVVAQMLQNFPPAKGK